jgi:hypothetical protein
MTGPAVQVRCMSCPSSPAQAKRSDHATTMFSGIFK